MSCQNLKDMNTALTAPTDHDIITVFGATGKTGIPLLQTLSRKGMRSRAVTRDLNNITSLPYVDWVEGDLSNTTRIYDLVAGSTRIFLNTSFSPKMAEMQEQVIEAAKKAGVQHIIKLSYGIISAEVLQTVNSITHTQHKQIEQTLIQSGIPYTILRASGFMQNWLTEFPGTIRQERKIYAATGAGKMPYIDTRDIAEVAAIAFSHSPEIHGHNIYELTGNEPVSFFQVADAIGQRIGEPVTYIAESTQETRERLSKKGYPEWAIHMLLCFAQSQRDGKETYTTNTVEELLNRPATDIYTFARDYANWFK